MLRKKGVVGKFVEFYGDGLNGLSSRRSRHHRQHGARIRRHHRLFPHRRSRRSITLRLTNRPPEQIALVEAYAKEQGLFLIGGAPEPVYSRHAVARSRHRGAVAGRTQAPAGSHQSARREEEFPRRAERRARAPPRSDSNGSKATIQDGSVVIAAITSCTNTSNPSVMVAAGLLAKKAVERGLKSKPWVKTSLAPGSKVVMDYLNDAGLTPYLEAAASSTWSATAAPLASATADRCRKRSPTPCRRKSSRSPRCCPAIAISKAASIRWCKRQLSRVAAAGGRLRARRPRRYGSRPHEPLGQDPAGKDVFLETSGRRNEEVQAAVMKSSVRREMFAETIRRSISRATPLERR